MAHTIILITLHLRFRLTLAIYEKKQNQKSTSKVHFFQNQKYTKIFETMDFGK